MQSTLNTNLTVRESKEVAALNAMYSSIYRLIYISGILYWAFCVEYDFRLSDGCICILKVTIKPLGIIYFHGNVYYVRNM
jgi:hypothetical protein